MTKSAPLPMKIPDQMTVNIGKAVGLLWVADSPEGTIENLRNAAWYVQREIEKREKEASK